MKKLSFLFIIMLSLLFGCQHLTHQIPIGKYVADAKKEYIIVKPSTMFFHLKVIGKSNVFIDREYEYNLLEDGTIWPCGGIASGEYFLGIGQYILLWDGKNIIVKEVKTGNVIILKRFYIQTNSCLKNETK